MASRTPKRSSGTEAKKPKPAHKKRKTTVLSPQKNQNLITDYFSCESKIGSKLSSDASCSQSSSSSSGGGCVREQGASTSGSIINNPQSTEGSTSTDVDGTEFSEMTEENRSPIELTEEQVHIIEHDVNNGDLIKIEAFAGTGKTTTLVEYTKMRPKKKFLNVAYNRSVQEHAKKKFPTNVENRTTHSLGYEHVGSRYKHKFPKGGQLRIKTVMNALPAKSGYLHAKRVMETLNNFIASADVEIGAKHVPPFKGNNKTTSSCSERNELFGEHGSSTDYLNSPKYREKVVSQVEMLWERMKDVDDKEFPMTHDGYLKMYQLSKPDLSGYDCLLIDEAQDCSPAVSDILLRQSCARILVGDPHQQIYSFRGARNVLQDIESNHTFYLTQSFRFGSEIAELASSVLAALKGTDKIKSIVGRATAESNPSIQLSSLQATQRHCRLHMTSASLLGDKSEQFCVITRTNYTLFNEAASVCKAKEDVKVDFFGKGGIKGLNLDRVSDIHKLLQAGSNRNGELGIIDPLIKHFGTFSELTKYARLAPDPELMGKIKIAETHKENLGEVIDLLKSKAVSRKSQKPDIIFSTAHKAKGLEYDHVRVADDFLLSLTDSGLSITDLEDDEKNLLYVAISRAKKSVRLSRKILDALHLKFTSCGNCRCHIEEELFVLGGEGFFCSSCAHSKAPNLGCLDLKPSYFNRFRNERSGIGNHGFRNWRSSIDFASDYAHA